MTIRIPASLLPALLLLAMSCGSKPPEGSLVVPRGATVAVVVTESISAASHPSGSPFAGELAGPLSLGSTVYVPGGAKVEGVVEVESHDSSATVILRLKSVADSSGRMTPVETLPMSRSATSAVAATTELSASSGLNDKIRFLAEIEEAGGGAEDADGDAGALVPANTEIVFTLAKDLILAGAQ